jgi:hypothetical protein
VLSDPIVSLTPARDEHHDETDPHTRRGGIPPFHGEVFREVSVSPGLSGKSSPKTVFQDGITADILLDYPISFRHLRAS